ncbi:MAG TPA: hypothetical protein VG737_17630 [Cyclobacteriaceae bacterium]|nr:hypothetical protein [Cyclobacteriaceae bacterium]
MKNTLMIAIMFVSLNALAQDAVTKKMEARAKELIAVISQPDKEVYRKFIKANYTEAFINKKMRLTVEGGPGGSSENGKNDPVEDKVNMYTRLHKDLGQGKIVSMKQIGEKLEVEADGSTGASMSFGITYQKTEPYLIDGLSVQLVMRR